MTTSFTEGNRSGTQSVPLATTVWGEGVGGGGHGGGGGGGDTIVPCGKYGSLGPFCAHWAKLDQASMQGTIR